MDMDWGSILTNFVNGCISIAGRLLLSALVFVVGMFLIKLLLKLFPNGKKFTRLDETVRIFLTTLLKLRFMRCL